MHGYTVNGPDGEDRDIHFSPGKALWDYLTRNLNGNRSFITMPSTADGGILDSPTFGPDDFEHVLKWFGNATGYSDPSTKYMLKRLQEELDKKSNMSNNFNNIPIKSKDAINPSHYQSYFGGIDNDTMEELQWLEAMQYMHNFRNPDNFKAAVELQIRKYLDRNGKKDEEVQELLKSVWYTRFLAAYIKNGNKPIRVKQIPTILGDK